MEIPRLIEENQILAQNINPNRAYLNEPFFKPEIMENKSLAAKGNCSCIIIIVQYFDVISIILPKQKALAEVAELLAAATTKFEQLNAIVAELQAQLAAEKEAEYNKAMGEKNAAEAEENRCQMKLGLAQRLVNALGSENDR
jgi:dynein heavy chain